VAELTESTAIIRRRQPCARCGQLLFEFHSSPDGHFGLVDEVCPSAPEDASEIRCPTCDARYRLLDRLDPTGRPVARK
jgi:DNA-directed RNA polymerase subunit RPC12/RpoP